MINKAMAWMGVGIGLVLTASANQIQFGYAGSSYGPYQTAEGGEFTLVPVSPPGWLDLSGYSSDASGIGVAGSFQSFCIEYNEHIYPHGVYNAVINTDAVCGGIPQGSDELSVGTGWLYSQFALGTLEDYNYDANRRATAGQLQNAIWMLEGEIAYNALNPYVQLVTTQFGSWSDATTDGASSYGVFALNLTDAAGGRNQDQLYYQAKRIVPDGGMTLLLLGVALGCIGWVSRRWKK